MSYDIIAPSASPSTSPSTSCPSSPDVSVVSRERGRLAYRVLPEYFEDGDASNVPSRLDVFDTTWIELVRREGGPTGAGGLGSVFEYVDPNTPETSVALKVTIVAITDADPEPDESHHVTEAAAPRRLLDLDPSCSCLFVDTFVASDDGVNARLVHDDGGGGEKTVAYTTGKTNPLTLHSILANRPRKHHHRKTVDGKTTYDVEAYGEAQREHEKTWKEALEGLEPENAISVEEILSMVEFEVILFTVMRKAEGSLFDLPLRGEKDGHDIAVRALDLARDARKCLRDKKYYYKDVKMDQILVFRSVGGSGVDLRLGDLGNLCRAEEDACEFGSFDDPLNWECVQNPQSVLTWRKKDEKTSVERGLEWQACALTCELACALFENTANRRDNVVYGLIPHVWKEKMTEPEAIVDVFTRLEKIVEIVARETTAERFGEYADHALRVLRDTKIRFSSRSKTPPIVHRAKSANDSLRFFV